MQLGALVRMNLVLKELIKSWGRYLYLRKTPLAGRNFFDGVLPCSLEAEEL